jgi:hypothetical protein
VKLSDLSNRIGRGCPQFSRNGQLSDQKEKTSCKKLVPWNDFLSSGAIADFGAELSVGPRARDVNFNDAEYDISVIVGTHLLGAELRRAGRCWRVLSQA